MTSLAEIRAALERQLSDPGKFHFVNTRLILTTGVNLNHFSPEENTDPKRISNALRALASMGLLDGKGNGHG